MSEKTTDSTLGEKRLHFSWVDRFLKPIAKLGGWIGGLQAERVEIVYWFLTLLAIVPAIRAELLFPFDWSQGIGLDYTVSWFNIIFTYLHLDSSTIAQIAIVSAILLLTVLVLFMIAVARRSVARLIALMPHLTILLPYLAINLNVFKDQPTWLFWANGVYVGTAFLSFLYFIVAGRVRSFYFLLFLVFLSAWQVIDELFGWQQIIAFVAASFVLSLIYETARQNWPLLKQLGRHGALVLLWRTFNLWSPTLLLIALGLWVSDQITSATEKMLYEQGVVTPYCVLLEAQPSAHIKCPQKGTVLMREAIVMINNDPEPDVCVQRHELGPESGLVFGATKFGCPANFSQVDMQYAYRLSHAPFFISLDLTLADKFRLAHRNLSVVQREFQNARFLNPVWVGHEARRMFSFVPHDTGLIEKDCGLLDVKCGTANLVKSILNGAYADIRSRAERRFVASAKDRATGVKKITDSAVKDATKEFKDVLNTLEQQTRKTIYRVYQTSKVIQILMMAWLIIIAIKSFLYVFSRVIFDKSTDIHVDLLEHGIDPKQGSVKHLQEITIKGDYPYNIYYKSNFQPLGPAPRFSIPQWRSSLLSRIRFGAWNMNRVDMPLDHDRGVTFNAIEAEYLVDWHMEDGEEIIFSYGNFVAMNENVELRTVISLRVATMLMGRFIFHTARCKGGSGRLILRTRGKPATAEQVRQSIPASRLIAWNRYARFSVDSHLTRADIFLNGFNLRRSESDDNAKPQGIIVVEADARSGSIMIGTLRFAKHFLLPV